MSLGFGMLTSVLTQEAVARAKDTVNRARQAAANPPAELWVKVLPDLNGRRRMMGTDYDEATERARLRAARGECPVSVAVEIGAMCRLVDLADICAQDVIADAAARYPGDGPTETRRRANDQADAVALLEMVAELRGKLPLSENGE